MEQWITKTILQVLLLSQTYTTNRRGYGWRYYTSFVFASSRLVYIVAMNDTWIRVSDIREKYIELTKMWTECVCVCVCSCEIERERLTDNRQLVKALLFWFVRLHAYLNSYCCIDFCCYFVAKIFIVVLIVVLLKLTMQSTQIKASRSIWIKLKFSSDDIFCILLLRIIMSQIFEHVKVKRRKYTRIKILREGKITRGLMILYAFP